MTTTCSRLLMRSLRAKHKETVQKLSCVPCRRLQTVADEPKLTIQDVMTKFVENIGLNAGYSPLQHQRGHLLKFLPKDQSELPTRTMKDSFDTAIIPLSSNPKLQEKYITFLGSVRTGRLLEDMDIFAVYLAHKHIMNPKQEEGMETPYVLVTALIDKINFQEVSPKPNADIRLSGHVSWVGKSSIETTVWLEQKLSGSWQLLTKAVFLLAARDPTNTSSAIVNKLVAETEEEKDIFQRGEENKKRRLRMQSESLFRVVPNEEEQRIIHDLFLNTIDVEDPTFHRRILPKNGFWMEGAAVTNFIFCHPENRNLYNKVFGGFLMNQAYELAWTNAYLYSKFIPSICHISDINFHEPVDVGSLLRMSAYVTYTDANYMQIMVNAEVFDPRSGEHNTTNVFHFTFKSPEMVPHIYPMSYNEAMMYIDGRRHFQHVMGLTATETAAR